MKRFLLVLVLFIFALIALAPTILSTGPFASLLTGLIGKQIGGELTVSNLSLSWFGQQKLEDIHFEKKQEMAGAADNLTIDAPLWKLIFFHPRTLKDALQFPGDITLQNGSVKLMGPEPILFSELDGTFQHQPASLRLTGKTSQKGLQGTLLANYVSDHLQVKLEKLPVQGIDELLSLKGMLADAIGPSLNLNLEADLLSNPQILDLTATSDRLTAEFHTTTKNNALTLTRPGIVKCLLTASFLQKWVFSNQATVQNDSTLLATIDQLNLPQSLDLSALQFHSSLTLTPIKTDLFTMLEFRCIASSSAIKQGVHFTAHLDTVQDKGVIAENLGNTFALDVAGTIQDNHGILQVNAASPLIEWPGAAFNYQNKAFILSSPIAFSYLGPKPFQLQIQKLILPSPLENFEFAGTLNLMGQPIAIACQTLKKIQISTSGNWIKTNLEASLSNETLTIRKPFDLEYKLTPEELHKYSPELTLLKPANLRFHFEPFSIPLKDIRFDQLQLKGSAESDQLVFEKGTLTKPNAQFQLGKNMLNAKISSGISSKENPISSLSIQLNATDFNLESLDKSLINADIQVSNLSTPFLESFFPSYPLTGLIGPSLSISAQLQSSPAQTNFDIDAKTPLLNIVAKCQIQDHMITLRDNKAEIHLKLTKESYERLDEIITKQKISTFELMQPSLISCLISDFHWPVTQQNRIPTLSSDLSQVQVKGDVQINQLSLASQEMHERADISNLNLHFEKNSATAFNLTTTIAAKEKSGTLQAKGIANAEAITLEANCKGLPVIILDFVARLNGKTNAPFTALFGSNVDLNTSIQLKQYTGPIQFSLISPNTRASLKGKLTQGVLSLDENFYAQVKMTPELSRLILDEFNPLSLSSITSQNPITLEIKKEKFSLPLHPYDITQATIPAMHIELGQIACKNEGNVHFTLDLLKSSSKLKELKLWFTPIDLHLAKGNINWERTEILLADTYELALWGDIDLKKDYVDMVLGLTSQCLKKAFGIRNLPNNYVLQIPLKGKMEDVKLDTKGATVKVTALLLWQQNALNPMKEGKAKELLGEFLGKVGALPDMKAKAPPPKHPFPWEKGKESSIAEELPEPSRKKSIRKKDIKPLKQLLKILR